MWADESTATTITLTYNIYSNVMLVDDNAPWDIKNFGTSAKTVYMWVEDCDKPRWFTSFTIQILK